MKFTYIFLLSSLLLCGCSQNQPASVIDQIQPGKDVSWNDGPVLRITKRVGTSLEGVTITAKLPNGQKQLLKADTATLSADPNAANGNSVIITLHKATTQVGGESAAVGEFPIHLGK